MILKKDVAIIIPTHKEELSDYERISLSQCCKVLGNYDIFLMVPEGLSITNYQALYPELEIIYFPKNNFLSIITYNKLISSYKFFNYFSEYKYLLIHELDSFVFKDALVDWCNQGYDYIGAPWIGESNRYRTYLGYATTSSNLFLDKLKKRLAYKNRKKVVFVGNGGFSLRRVRSFKAISRLLPYIIPGFDDAIVHDDIIWSIYVSSYFPFFKIPDYKIALQFSMELQPRYCFAQNQSQLPFGCHAWYKYDQDFWKPHIEKAGYEIA